MYHSIWCFLETMAISIFLEEYDFSSKMIIMFASYEGSGLGNRLAKIVGIYSDAQSMDEFVERGI